jgi:hypothetical protein
MCSCVAGRLLWCGGDRVDSPHQFEKSHIYGGPAAARGREARIRLGLPAPSLKALVAHPAARRGDPVQAARDRAKCPGHDRSDAEAHLRTSAMFAESCRTGGITAVARRNPIKSRIFGAA